MSDVSGKATVERIGTATVSEAKRGPLCPRCEGSGRIIERMDGNHGVIGARCPVCRGSGEAVNVAAIARQAATAPHTLSIAAPLVDARESAFQKSVVDLAHLCRWRVAYFRAGRVRRGSIDKYETAVGGDGRGFVDLIVVRERVVWMELKSETGRVRPDQVKWKNWLIAAGQEYHLFRPSSWPEIVRTLA